MGEPTPSKKSQPISLAEVDLPPIAEGKGPKEHRPRCLDPVVVDDYFRPLLKNIPTAEERWQRKAMAEPFEW